MHISIGILPWDLWLLYHPMGPLGCGVIIHANNSKQKSWYQWDEDRFNIGGALKHYRCFTIINKQTKATVVSDTVEFQHSYLIQPSLNFEDQLIHTMVMLILNIKGVTAVSCNAQLDSIKDIRELFGKWHDQSPPADKLPQGPNSSPRHAPPRVSKQSHLTQEPLNKNRWTPVIQISLSLSTPYPRVAPIPDSPPPRVTPAHPTPVSMHVLHESIAHQNCSRQPLANFVTPTKASRRKFPQDTINKWAMPVLDEETVQKMEYCQIRKHQKPCRYMEHLLFKWNGVPVPRSSKSIEW